MSSSNNHESVLRSQLVSHIQGGQAFSTIDSLISIVSFEKIGIVPNGLPYSFYQQFYHIWFAQNDIIEYCRNPNYTPPDWPNEYWPEETTASDKEEWEKLVQTFFDERNQFSEILMDSSNDLFKPFPSNNDHNLFREAELIIEHNAYHIGQLYAISRLIM